MFSVKLRITEFKLNKRLLERQITSVHVLSGCFGRHDLVLELKEKMKRNIYDTEIY